METIQLVKFWTLLEHLVIQAKYRVIKIGEHEREIWLEATGKRPFPFIRIVRKDLDWGSAVERELNDTLRRSQSLTKQWVRTKLNVLTIQLTTQLPVDDWQYAVGKTFETDKVRVQGVVIATENEREALVQLEQLLQVPISLQTPEPQSLEHVRRKVVQYEQQRIDRERRIFIYGKPILTFVFLTIQVFVFAWMTLNGGTTNTNNLIQFGAKFNPLILSGEWWRFVTPIFIHIGFLHLLMNSFALYFIGESVERIYGTWRFFVIYILAGIAGVIASFVLNTNISAGASGAIFGLFGALLYFGVIYPHLFARTMGRNVITIILINLAFGFVVPGIDNAGHIGGLIGGFLAAGFVSLPSAIDWRRQLGNGLLFAVIIATLVSLGMTRINDGTVQQAVSLANMYINNDKLDEAYKVLSALEQKKLKDDKVFFLMSYIEIKQNRYEQAERHLRAALKQNPILHEAYYNLALLYEYRKDYEQAYRYSQEALQIRPREKEYQNLNNEIKQYLDQQ